MIVPPRFQLAEPPVETLPYPPVSPLLLRAAEDAIAEAWRRFLALPVDLPSLFKAHEDDITAPLINELARMCREGFGAFRQDSFAAVVKSEELQDFSGKEVQKRPDIILRLVPNPTQVLEERYYAVFVEAKVLNRSAKKRIKRYCSQGIARFCTGRYAWKMREGMLVAYVLDGSTLRAVLHPEIATPMVPRAWPTPARAEIATTHHDRAWSYQAPNHGTPGSIALSHVWLRPA